MNLNDEDAIVYYNLRGSTSPTNKHLTTGNGVVKLQVLGRELHIIHAGAFYEYPSSNLWAQQTVLWTQYVPWFLRVHACVCARVWLCKVWHPVCA